jgi:hypothetical protein
MMDDYIGRNTHLIIAFHGGLYVAIIMHRCEGPYTLLTIALIGGLYLAMIMDRY